MYLCTCANSANFAVDAPHSGAGATTRPPAASRGIMLHLMVLLVMVFLLGSISTFVWAYSLSSVGSTERSEYYLQQL